MLVRNAIGKSLELWPSDLPKNKATQLAELGQLAKLTGVRVKEIQRRMSEYAGDPLTPVVIKRGLHDDQISYYDEHQLDFPGVQLRDSYLRSYPYQSLAAHVLGSVGEITQSELKAKQKQGYKLGDVIGQAGVEATYDSYLRGTNGTQQVTVDSRGRPTSAVTPKVTPRAGNTIRLTIDIGIQRAAERALVAGIRLARANGDQFADGGAIVALDPRDGSVLAMASYPTYKPSVYVSRDPTKLAPLLGATDLAAKKNFPGSTARSTCHTRRARHGSR